MVSVCGQRKGLEEVPSLAEEGDASRDADLSEEVGEVEEGNVKG